MPRASGKTTHHAASSDNSGKYICAECGVDAGKMDVDQRGPGVWVGDVGVFHCDGKSRVFGAKYRGEVHHFPFGWGDCWKCGQTLGCQICTGIEQELLCENFAAHGGLGAVWATKRAFLEHGPLIRQRHGRRQALEDYPREWAMEYEPLEVKPTDLALVKDLLKRTWR